jgi:hypothetical protein
LRFVVPVALDLTVRADRRGENLTVTAGPLAGNCQAIGLHSPAGVSHRIEPEQAARSGCRCVRFLRR